ncbi:neuroblastoma breakpoint family member 4-like, partial [Dama dama]|uniref:neuroblastoma breakpoint family member 4-like n=1 Tax=Dama dama TaxID=30532 RepID=UPI002A35AB47
MAVCLPSLSDLRAQCTLMEINQELQLQLEKYKQDFRDLTEKFLVSQATAYSLANHLQKYNCKACKDIVESVLGEKLPVEVRRPAEKLAEKPTLDERLRTSDVLIRSQARELTQLRQTLQDGKDDSVLLKQHLKDLLTHSDLDNHQGQGFRESLSEGYRLAERLACKLSPETDEDEDEVDEQAQETPTPRFSRQMPQMVEDGVPQNSLDDYYLTYSVLPNLSDSFWPYRSTAIFSPEDLDVSYARDVTSDTWEDCHQEPVSFPGSEVPTSQAQLQKSTHVTDCLQWQLDQHLECELDVSIRMKNPPKLEGEGSTASTQEHP